MQITEASVRPGSGDGIVPDSWGHVCHWRHPDPRPEDCWSGSAWFETWAITALAGYVIAELLDSDWFFRFEDWDHRCVLDLLREFSPRDPGEGVRRLAQLRERTQRLLIRPEVMEGVVRAADLLLAEEEVNGTSFYQALYGGQCRARHPSLTEVRCQKDPHPFGGHVSRTEPGHSEPLIIWDGLPPPRNQQVGAMTGSQKRIRAINRGQAPRSLPKAWRDALDDYTWSLAGR